MSASSEDIPVYADENIDLNLVLALRLWGLDVVSAREVQRLGESDADQLAYATAEGRVLRTHDIHDFVRLHHGWTRAGHHHAGIAILPQTGPVSRRAARAALLMRWFRLLGAPVDRLITWDASNWRFSRVFTW